MKLHFFGKKSMSLKRFYRYVLITILLVILCFVLTAVCLTFISQKNKILTHTHSVLANIAEEYQGIEKTSGRFICRYLKIVTLIRKYTTISATKPISSILLSTEKNCTVYYI